MLTDISPSYLITKICNGQNDLIVSLQFQTHVQPQTLLQKNRMISTRGNENSTRDLNKLIPLVDRCTTYTNYYCVEEKTVKPVIVKWKNKLYWNQFSVIFYQPWYSMVTHYKYLTCAVRSVKSTATVIDWARRVPNTRGASSSSSTSTSSSDHHKRRKPDQT